jgi:hypothetical protein
VFGLNVVRASELVQVIGAWMASKQSMRPH